MKFLLVVLAFQFHRAEQSREIRYWLLDPQSHQFHISHDFTVDKVGQKAVYSFVRKGSDVSPDSKMFNLDSGEKLFTHVVKAKEVNPDWDHVPADLESLVVQGDLPKAVGEGQSVRIRVEETYTDPVGYAMKGNELVWTRTLGRPLNFVTLPAGWALTGLNTPAVISLDAEGRIMMRFTNIRNDELAVTIRARKR
jgi:hypothetical protein